MTSQSIHTKHFHHSSSTSAVQSANSWIDRTIETVQIFLDRQRNIREAARFERQQAYKSRNARHRDILDGLPTEEKLRIGLYRLMD